MMLLIQNAQIITPDSKFLGACLIKDGEIKAIFEEPFPNLESDESVDLIDAKNRFLAPGLIDLQLNGAFGHDFLTSDGKRIMVTALTKAQWRRLKTAMGITKCIVDLEREQKLDLDNEGDRYKARDKIVSLIEPWVASRDYSTIKKILDEAGVLLSLIHI